MSQFVEITHPDGRKTLKPLKGVPQRQDVDAVAVLIEALKRKGVDLTEADLSAAAQVVQARRKGPAGAGKQL